MCECLKLPQGFSKSDVNSYNELSDGETCCIPCIFDAHLTDKGGSVSTCCGLGICQSKMTNDAEFIQAGLGCGLLTAITSIKKTTETYFSILCCCTGPICIFSDRKEPVCGWDCLGFINMCNCNYWYSGCCCCTRDCGTRN